MLPVAESRPPVWRVWLGRRQVAAGLRFAREKNAATWQHTVQHEPEVGHGIELESRELVEAEMGWIDFRQIRPESQVSINLCFVSTGRVAALQSRRDVESIAFFDASTLFNACPPLGAVSS